MGTEGFPRDLANQLKQDLTFSLHAERQVRTKEVLEAAAAAITLRELRTVRPAGLGRFFVTVNSLRAVDKLRDLGGLKVGEKTFPLVSLASKTRVVTVLNLPAELPDYDLDAVLGQYGRIISSHRERYRDYPTVETGARKVHLEMAREVPNFITVRGFQAMCLYSGMRKVCRRCGEEGHFAADCSTPRCRRCLAYGHETATCNEPCKKCGADHWSSRCRVATYASVTNEQSTAMAVDGAYDDEIRRHQELVGENNDTAHDESNNTEVAIASSEAAASAGTVPSKDGNTDKGVANASPVVLGNEGSTSSADQDVVTAELEERRTPGRLDSTEQLDSDVPTQGPDVSSLSSVAPLVIDEDIRDSEEEDGNAGPPQPKRPHTSSDSPSTSSSQVEEWHTADGRKTTPNKKPRPAGEKSVIPVPSFFNLFDDEVGDN